MSDAVFTWSDATVREALGLRKGDPGDEVEYLGVTTDSRSASEGDLYVALVGEKFDGHDFVADAVAAGARGVIVSHPAAGADHIRLYPVDDTLVALGRLAGFRRRHLSATVVGITGSSGKTTTKELMAAALREARRVHATSGNLNNRIGLPMTLLRTPRDAEVVVAEMGTNEPGEIATLTAIAEPDISVVTTVGESHLEKLGSLEGVLKEKLDILRGLPEGGRGVVSDQPPSLAKAARQVLTGVRVAGWSELADEDLRPVAVEVDAWGHHTFLWRGAVVRLQVPGRHAVQNALLALAVAEMVGVAPEEAAVGIGSARPGSMRGEVREIGDMALLLDCYNANPQSVRASLDLMESRGDVVRRVVVLGTMLELGEQAAELHRDVLEDALARGFDLVVATGGFARAAAEVDPPKGAAGLVAAEDTQEAYEQLRERLRGDELVLLKASRGVALETLVPRFEEDFG